MLRWNCAALALLSACGSFAPEPAPAEPDAATPTLPNAVRWQRSLADAELLARELGLPLLLALNMDGESASDRIWFENYRDPAFVAASHRCVCVVGSVFRHNAVDHDAHGRRIECPRFPGITCGEHIALEPAMYERYLADGERVAPRHALVRPDGSKAFDLSLCFDIDDVTRALVAATPGQGGWHVHGDATTRCDAAGRAELEHRLATTTDAAVWRRTLADLAVRGNARSLDALRVSLGRVPTLPAAPIGAAVLQMAIAPEFANLVRERAQRVLEPGGLTPPPDCAALMALVEDTSVSTRVWLAAERVVHAEADPALPAALARAFANADDVPSWRDLSFATAPNAHLDVTALLTEAAHVVQGLDALPRPGFVRRDPPPAEALHAKLQELDARLAKAPQDAAALAEAGIASLDLGRHQEAAPTAQTALLFEDAEKYLQRALDLDARQFAWWIERARVAYQRQRFGDQHRHAVRALQAAGFRWPLHADERARLLQDVQGLEALRWLGDADARLLANAPPADAATCVPAIHTTLLALGLPAISPFGRGRDWVSFASFAGSVGLLREELALLLHAQTRLPADGEVRQAVYGALWRANLWDHAATLAKRCLGPFPGADALWWAGHANVLVAEELRRRERTAEALTHYAAAMNHFLGANAENRDYAGSCNTYRALAHLGSGHACVQGPGADRSTAAKHLLRALPFEVDLTTLRDGLGYDVLDLVDKVLEWRATGPSPVDGMALLDELTAAAPKPTPFWASAVSDSLLREALRADGRNPQRTEAETVDAGGKPIRMAMGLPTELGDRYLAGALAAGERAVAMPDAQDLDRQLCAQAQLIAAERELARGRLPRVAALGERAAATVAFAMPPAPTVLDSMAYYRLRTWLAPLRAHLGPARPRQRDGR